MNEDEVKQQVYEIVKNIPPGYVLTYGSIALLIGKPKNARMVGKIMKEAPGNLQAHRVVNHSGRTVPGWAEQCTLLEKEGVTIKENGCIDLKKHLWISI